MANLMNCLVSRCTTDEVLSYVDEAILSKWDNGVLDCVYNSWDIRDARVRAQRALAQLQDLELWEPEKLSKHALMQMQVLREFIADCNCQEAYLRASK
jgi:hypothetical protein